MITDSGRTTTSSERGTMLLLEEDKLGRCRVIQDALEVHGVVDLVFSLENFVKLEVIMTISQSVKINITIILSIES